MIYVIEDQASDVKVAELVKSGAVIIEGLYQTTTDAYLGEHVKYQMESKSMEYTEDFIHEVIEFISEDEQCLFNDVLEYLNGLTNRIEENPNNQLNEGLKETQIQPL